MLRNNKFVRAFTLMALCMLITFIAGAKEARAEKEDYTMVTGSKKKAGATSIKVNEVYAAILQ